MKPIWMFPKIWVPQNGWFIIKNTGKMDDLGVFPYFWKHPNLQPCNRDIFGDMKPTLPETNSKHP